MQGHGLRELSIPAGWRHTGSTDRRRRGWPAADEALFYLKTTGARATLAKLVHAFVSGRQRWRATREDLTRWEGRTADAPGFELRYARVDDLPRMAAFRARQHPRTIETWCGPDHFFFIALKDGEAVAYRVLSKRVHPLVERYLTLKPHQLYVVDEFTVPAFRRQGLTRATAIAMNPMLILGGFREVVGLYRLDNNNTIAATRAKGISTVGTLTRTCVLGAVSYRYEPAAA
jgi:hypothetical protein